MEGDDDYAPMAANCKDFYREYSARRTLSPEIVEEIPEVSKSTSYVTAGSTSRDIEGANDVYVAVGKDDTDVLKWALGNAVSPGSCVFLVHVFPPITHIPTPVGKLSKSQLSEDQVRFYIDEENNRRRNLLQKYVCLCNDAKVTVDTMLLESDCRAKAIVELIPVLNISHLVIGIKRPTSSRLHYVAHAIRRKKLSIGEFVLKKAPEFCKVSLIHEGKKVKVVDERVNGSQMTRPSQRSIFEWACFPGFLEPVEQQQPRNNNGDGFEVIDLKKGHKVIILELQSSS